MKTQSLIDTCKETGELQQKIKKKRMKIKLRKPISVKIVKPERTDPTHKSPTPNCDTREDLVKVLVRFDQREEWKAKRESKSRERRSTNPTSQKTDSEAYDTIIDAIRELDHAAWVRRSVS